MKKILVNALSQNGFIVLNKALIKYFENLDLACVLSFFIDKWAYFNGEDFYYTIENIKEDTFLSERNIRTCIKKLIDLNILIKKNFQGIPPKQYYSINYEMLANILNEIDINIKNDSNNTIKNNTLNPCKNDRVNTCNFDSDIISNKNKINKNKDINNKLNKKNTKKDLKTEAINLFYSFENEIKYFTIEDWIEWIDYKLTKETKITIATFNKNIKQLINFGINAKASIDNSISSNWSGLFDIKNNSKNNIDYSLMHSNEFKKEFDDEWDYMIKNGSREGFKK